MVPRKLFEKASYLEIFWSVFSPNVEKYGLENLQIGTKYGLEKLQIHAKYGLEKFQIKTLLTQW